MGKMVEKEQEAGNLPQRKDFPDGIPSYGSALLAWVHLVSSLGQKMQPWLPSICNLTEPLLLKFYILFPSGKSLAICDLQLVFKNWLPFQIVLLKHPKLFVCVSE